METTLRPARPGWDHRLHAVLALLGGKPVSQVATRFGMGRSILYKWRHRALTALQGALTDHRPGPQCPAKDAVTWNLKMVAEMQMSRATIRRMRRAMQQAQPPPPPQWRFYARHHPQSLWRGDCLEQVCDQATGRQRYQVTLLDDSSRG